MNRIASLLLAATLVGCAARGAPTLAGRGAVSPVAPSLTLPASAQQGTLVTGRTLPGSRVEVDGREARVAADGTFVFGIPRDASGARRIRVMGPGGSGTTTRALNVLPRDWPVEHVNGVPPSTVDPPPAIVARIKAEQARVSAARLRDDARTDFASGFVRPVQGHISGRFGNRRVYNGTPGAPHSGMDIAAPVGTPVLAPAAGVVTFADPALYLTGGTLVLDHGHGVSSNFLHLSRIDVRVGERVERGQRIAAVGATGRATGPHLHWGMNWFDVRVDPLLVLEAAPAAR